MCEAHGIANDAASRANKINESKINESKINESKINESKINESKINESKINESKINDTSKWKTRDKKEEADACGWHRLIYEKD